MLSDGIKLNKTVYCDFLPNTGENGIIYRELSTNNTYIYFDNLFHQMASSADLGGHNMPYLDNASLNYAWNKMKDNLQSKENSPEKTRCEYCGRLHSSEIEICPSCGAIA